MFGSFVISLLPSVLCSWSHSILLSSLLESCYLFQCLSWQVLPPLRSVLQCSQGLVACLFCLLCTKRYIFVPWKFFCHKFTGRECCDAAFIQGFLIWVPRMTFYKSLKYKIRHMQASFLYKGSKDFIWFFNSSWTTTFLN